MLRDLIKEGGLYTIASFLTKGVSLLLIPFYADYFSTEEYGIIAILGIAGALSAAFFSFQLYQGVGRFISPKQTSLDDQKKIGSTGFWFTFLSYLTFVLLAFIFKDNLIDLLSEDVRIADSTYIWCLFAVALNGLFNTLSVQLKFLRKTKAFSITTFLYAILNIIFIIIFALGLDYRVDSIYMATIVVSPFLILLQFYYLKDYFIFYLGKLELKKLLKFSSPLIPAALAYLVLNVTDRIFIKEITHSMGQAGIYEMAFKFSSIVSIIIISFQSALAPLIYENHADVGTKKQLTTIFKLFIGIGTIGGLCLSFFSYETLYIFTNEKFYSASVVMPLFYVTVLITGLGMFSPGLHLKDKTRIIPFVVAISAIINVVLNYLFIPDYGILGAALATLISVIINNVVLFVISQKLYHIPLENKKGFATILLFIIAFLAGNYLIDYLNIDYVLGLLLKILVIGLYFFYIVQIKFINLGAIKERLIRKKSDKKD